MSEALGPPGGRPWRLGPKTLEERLELLVLDAQAILADQAAYSDEDVRWALAMVEASAITKA